MDMHQEAREAQIDAVKEWALRSGMPGWNPDDCAASRKTFREASAIKIVAPLPVLDQVEDVTLDLPSGPRAARVYRGKPNAQKQAIIYVHGGGYAVGGLTEADAECRRLADSIGVDVVSITYRLAPEHPYPAGIEDVVDAVGAVRAGQAGLAADQIVLLGVSAGAGLVVAATRLLLEAGQPPAGLMLLSPWLDMTLTLPSCSLYRTGYFQELAQLVDFRRLYVTGDLAFDHPDLSPARHPVDPSWPKTLILAAEMDPMADDAALFARRLSEAGVPHELRYAKGHLHGFHTWWQRMPSILPDLAWFDDAARKLVQRSDVASD